MAMWKYRRSKLPSTSNSPLDRRKSKRRITPDLAEVDDAILPSLPMPLSGTECSPIFSLQSTRAGTILFTVPVSEPIVPYPVPYTPFVLPQTKACPYCRAIRFQFETKGFCCSDGNVLLASNESPPLLWHLFTSTTDEAHNFRTYVRTYNNTFAFTSFGVKYDKDLCKKNRGIYTFKAHGQVYHYINNLLPGRNNPSYLQLYFYDTAEQLEHRLRQSDRLDRPILETLIDLMKENPYSRFFRTLNELPSSEEFKIIIRNHSSLDQRVFNAPTTSQVAAIWVETENNETQTRDIVVFSKPGVSHSVRYYYGCYDPLQYPLLFPLGEPGWHEGIERPVKGQVISRPNQDDIDLNEAYTASELLEREEEVLQAGQRKRSVISCREYYAYKLQIRPQDRSVLLHSGRLLQQYVVDMYIKLETSRLDYFRLNQETIRQELYKGIADSIANGEVHGNNVGSRVILPATFIGGPRDMRRRYLDAMSLVQRFGKPDLFITMTCNPTWPEITEQLLPSEEAQNRPDLIARVFRGKLEELKNDLFKRQILGPVAGYVYVVEFQKRGLPHCHFLIIFKKGSKIKSPDIFDRYVSAEIPCPQQNPHLHRAVWKPMMHGPCGLMNMQNACMKNNGTCKNHYPKEFCKRTTQRADSYPLYKRSDNNRNVKVRGHILDNRWVVPYNAYLLAKFDCHLNVEICSTIKAVKYLYKYIYKGHDRVSFRVCHDGIHAEINEIDTYQNARWVSPPEATWRIYRFLLNEISPAVLTLQIHLKNQQPVTYKTSNNLIRVISCKSLTNTMLTEYFNMNKINPEARKYLYKEFPEHFVWNKQSKVWTMRKRGFTIGRVAAVAPMEGARYYLRLLLNEVRGATCFEDLMIVHSVHYKSFRAAALARGLLEADNSLQLCLREATSYQMPFAMRRLFATILVYCNPVNARLLWEEFGQAMWEDFGRLPYMTQHMAKMKALEDLAFQLESMGRDINDFDLTNQPFGVENVVMGFREIEEELKIKIPVEDFACINQLNNEQKIAFHIIMARVFSGQAGAFFVDGPGGTGKTFLYRAILAALRSEGYIALATASSGVAASILPGGRTAHSRFKIPIKLDEKFVCKVSKQSGLARLIRSAKLILWDEAPMVRRQAIEAFDELLRDICESDLLFGGKVVVFGGDFRQVLPVVPRGTMDQTINTCLVKSNIWPYLEKIHLTNNMRAQLDPEFSDFLLRVGEGREANVNGDQIKIPPCMTLKFEGKESLTRLLNLTFPSIANYNDEIETMVNRVVLTPKNDAVEEINDILISQFPGELQQYNSFDTPIDHNYHGLQEDFFNTLNPSGFPPHILKLKLNCPIILLRNLDPSKGMCNGTRLICRSFGPNVIHAEIATGNYKGNTILLPRIPLLPADNEAVPYQFKRVQFPIRLCFGMSINKCQGQTLDFVGIYLPQPVFSHGQLYVALSRAKTSAAVKVLVESEHNQNTDEHGDCITTNVVYDEVLTLASIA